jgi:type IV secretion system protein VirB2
MGSVSNFEGRGPSLDSGVRNHQREGEIMKRHWINKKGGARKRLAPAIIRMGTLALLTVAVAHAQSSPWESAVTKLVQAVTGPLAKGLSLIAIVIGGLTLAYSEAGSKKQLAGIIFGIAMAVGAASFLAWLFGV